jgi:hypothetical protein
LSTSNVSSPLRTPTRTRSSGASEPPRTVRDSSFSTFRWMARRKGRPELRIEADFRQVLDGVIAELDLDVLRAEAAVNERSPPSMKARRLLG